MGNADALAIEDLATAAGVPVRTIRYYITEGLLPGPGARGKGASYSEEHLLRLKLIRRLGEQGLPLAQIGERLAHLSLPDLRALLREEEQHAAALNRVSASESARDYVSTLLARAREARKAPSQRGPPGRPTDPGSDRHLPFSMSLDEHVMSLDEEVSHDWESLPREPPPHPASWRRTTLAPGVELHVRTDAERTQRPLIRRLLRLASAPNHPSAEPDNVIS